MNIPASLRTSLHSHRALLLLVLAYTAVVLWLAGSRPTRHDIAPLLASFALAALTGPVFLLCAWTGYVMCMLRPARLCHFLCQELRRHLHRERLMHALPALLLVPLFALSFTTFKAAIPRLHPFDWDARLSAIDIALHGGTAPWAWLQPLLGHPLLTGLLNVAYHFWFLLFYALLYWLILDTRRPLLRMQFLLSFTIAWIVLGSVAALLFSSAGPCYYGHFHASDPYAPLMAYLHDSNHSIPVWALKVQDMLWQGYQSGGTVGELGISAMPSMHVATSVLMALVAWPTRRAAGIALAAFTVLIMLGSVHLGWHYALDGYVGAAGAVLIWQAVGLALRRRGAPASLPLGIAPCLNKEGVTP
ncbi:phosphatase PAP2 family protein [Janthinobacterium sp.]|uniref:phosphatase PAP2 family protein n=1 Tax=Janthinobacterium sp. TaxID=1871054 RepID=UPI00258D54C6|nr:phosphatase PAP2 family protein [Janthinobacterium sp.]MCX7294045.1 phosphatase PAP2 family protein [Janthinobacterium sp.]